MFVYFRIKQLITQFSHQSNLMLLNLREPILKLIYFPTNPLVFLSHVNNRRQLCVNEELQRLYESYLYLLTEYFLVLTELSGDCSEGIDLSGYPSLEAIQGDSR